MARVKTGPHRSRKHKKVLKKAKGFKLARGRHYKAAHETLLHAGRYAYHGRKLRKRDFRRLWIQRINAGLSQLDDAPSYSTFIHLLKQKDIKLNRKMLAELVVTDPDTFAQLVHQIYGK